VSALDNKQTLACRRSMSALHRKGDLGWANWDTREVPQTDWRRGGLL